MISVLRLLTSLTHQEVFSFLEDFEDNIEKAVSNAHFIPLLSQHSMIESRFCRYELDKPWNMIQLTSQYSQFIWTWNPNHIFKIN